MLNAQVVKHGGDGVVNLSNADTDSLLGCIDRSVSCVDTVLINWVKLCKDERFEIIFYDGKKYEGKIYFRDDQCFIMVKSILKGERNKFEKMLWENVYSIRILRDRSGVVLLYVVAIGFVAVFLSGVAAN